MGQSHFHVDQMDLQKWGHDPKAAFRQLLVEASELTLSILSTEYGPTLWQNHGVSFGPTGSVWGYGVFFWWIFFMHAGRLSIFAESAFVVFEDFTVLLACRIKQDKRAPVAACQDLLGVQLGVSTTVATAQPTPKRRAKLEVLKRRHLDAGNFSLTELDHIGPCGSCCSKNSFCPTEREISRVPLVACACCIPLDVSSVGAHRPPQGSPLNHVIRFGSRHLR